ncbi:aminotransferase class III-fold pyridoxal phosphate-dependent enzyme [Paenibacillus eucommiae]|uniref:Glutamate-1-semialdehyde aminotransferase n=1 Tax=Paenibacillus eucommiae TaxID=1355755 RepID=A0ABS4ITB1_9BACL|nr:aminotransferase class III-fold pyridoxal phosphate-dependent enzyme [Paenibacillus eucommiae]MBP1990800.1 glutamate-1-semialdehyde aminotransferase [Paenibacillus eucommiae]
MEQLGMLNGIQQSDHFWKRADGLIPCGTQCLSKGPTQFVYGYAPKYLVKGDGCLVTDADDNKFIDYGMGLGAVSIGYNDPVVNEAIIAQLKDAITLTLMHPLEVEVSELVREVIPCAESVRFGKNGSDVTTAAIRLARAYTGKDIVLCCGYHGWHDWYVITTERTSGIPPIMEELTKKFTYNDIDSLKALMETYKGRVAAVIMEPVGITMPQAGFLADVRDITHENGALLIFDEVLTGFRLSLHGAQGHFGVTPDLATFGKAVANGMPLSMLVGRKEIMAALEHVFFSFTFGGEMLSLAAAKATIQQMKARNTIGHVNEMGKLLKESGNALISKHGLADRIQIKGPDAKTLFVYSDSSEANLVKSFLQQEMIRRGILFTSYNYISYAHKQDHIQYTLDALDDCLGELSEARRQDNIKARIEGIPVAPVFRMA